MDPLTIGLLQGGGSLLGSIFGSQTAKENTEAQIAGQKEMLTQTEGFNAGEAEKARDFSANQAEIQRGYQSTMSNTAYQRASADMKSAGLNPMMMFGSGGAASTPSGAMGSGGAASVGTPTVPVSTRQSPLAGIAGIGEAASKFVSTAVQNKTIDKMTDEIANLQTTRGLISAETGLVKERHETQKEETLKTANEAQKLGLSMPSSRFSAKQYEDLLRMPDWLRSAAVQSGFIGGKASDALAPVTDLVSSARGMRNLFSERFHY